MRIHGKATGEAGFGILEILIALVIATVLMGVGWGGYKQFNEANTVAKAANQVAADLKLTRSYAIQRRANVSLVADEVERTYEIRESGGTALLRRFYDTDADLPLDALDIQTDGDSVTFNSRGLLVGNPITVEVTRGSRTRELEMNALGRTRVKPVN